MDKQEIAKSIIKEFGYEFDTSNDVGLLTLSFNKVESSIKNDCNISEIPAELNYVVGTRTAGEFLAIKNSIGSVLTTNNDDVQTVKEGDTQVTKFDKTSPAEVIRKKIADMTTFGKGEIARFRRFRW